MQNAGLAALGLDWRYLAFEVHPEHLKAALEGARAMQFIGLNLTVPHKLLAVDWVEVLDESAREWGAVNTIRFEGKNALGEWRPMGEFTETVAEVRARGFNTDAEAIVRALREDLQFELERAKVVLLGAGGAGRTAALKLASEQVAELYLVNRTVSKAEAVAKEIAGKFPLTKVMVGYPSGTVDLVLNATSLGLKTREPLPFDESRLSLQSCGAVYDMVYRPAETPLLKAARAAGRRNSNGLGMLLYQGARALELWTGRAAPVAAMRRALEKNVYG